jgi:hypothetical protein
VLALFVLGRNIYQATCGAAHFAESYIQFLPSKLEQLGEEIGFHIFNGILYEI